MKEQLSSQWQSATNYWCYKLRRSNYMGGKWFLNLHFCQLCFTSTAVFTRSIVLQIILHIRVSWLPFLNFCFQLKMEKQRFKNIRLFFKLMLLYEIYLLHTFTAAEASETFFSVSFEVYTATAMKEEITKTETDEESVLGHKRPARLLPLRMIL